MTWGRSGRAFTLAFTLVLGVAALPRLAAAQAVASWESSIGTIPGPNVSGYTVRQFARISIGGTQIRLRISNETGTRPLAVADVHIALPGSDPGSIQTSTDRIVTFNGGSTITVAPGAGVISDAIDMPVQPLTRLAVSAFFRSASPLQVGHLLASETNYLAPGDRAADAIMTGGSATTSSFYLSGISVMIGNLPGGVVACLGDSITDGLYSTPNTEHRWPDRLAERLLAASRGRVGAINAGMAGNGVLQGDPFGVSGPSALARLGRDALNRPGVHWIIVSEGINDIIFPPDAGDTAAELIAAYGRLVAQAHESGVKVFGATLTPFLGAGRGYYSAAREMERQRVNAWIRSSRSFDAFFDLDVAVRDPGEPRRLLPAFDGGDHLHLSDAGYAAIANAIPLGAILSGR